MNTPDTTVMIAAEEIDIPKDLRKKMDMGTDLMSNMYWSMKEQGQLQPIWVKQTNGGKFELIFGLKRLTCAKKLGWRDIRCEVVSSMDPEELEQAQLAENLFRRAAKDHPTYHVQLRKWLDIHQKNQGGLTDRQVAGKINGPMAQLTNGNGEAPQGGNGKFAVTPAEAEQPSRPSFSSKVAAATGQAVRQSRTDIKIAQSFTPDDLAVLGECEITQEHMLLIAKLDHAGKEEVLDAVTLGAKDVPALIAEYKEKQLQPEKPKEQKPLTEGEMNDEQWLQMCDDHGGPRPNIEDPKKPVYDREALLYREMRGGRDLLKAEYKENIKRRVIRGGGPFTNAWVRMFSVDHPQNWRFCGECNGSGIHPEHKEEKCDLCRGYGFVLTFVEKRK